MKATAGAYDGSPEPVVAIELEAERGDTVASLMHRAVVELTNEWLIKGQGKTWTTIIFSVGK